MQFSCLKVYYYHYGQRFIICSLLYVVNYKILLFCLLAENFKNFPIFFLHEKINEIRIVDVLLYI